MKQKKDYRADFELDEADIRLQWQFTKYLTKVVNSARQDYLKTLAKRKENEVPIQDEMLHAADAKGGTSEETLEQVLNKDMIRRTIIRLTPQERNVLNCVCVAEMSVRETASRLGISTGRVSQLKKSALNKLRRVFDGEEM